MNKINIQNPQAIGVADELVVWAAQASGADVWHGRLAVFSMDSGMRNRLVMT